MKYNPNKVVSAGQHSVNVLYTDTYKSSRVIYDESSILKSVQVTGHSHGKETYQDNAAIKLLYNHAMHGLKYYSPEEVKKMTYVQKMAIQELHEQAQYRLNKWKFELIHQKVAAFMTTVFHKSTFAKQLAEHPCKVKMWDRTPITFKQLGIRKEHIVAKLVEWNLLPVEEYRLA